MEKRSPIIAVMGHVDHGKTTLLDYIRKTNVAGREAGGITQSIGAYEIEHNGRKITFIDTPGHEAFSKMRERGAQVADLVILVVAADDGVKPQTKDALAHIKETNTQFVVAINKIDKENADVEKTKSDLASAGVFLEGYGGDVSWQAISAKFGDGVDDLLELVLLASDLESLEYDPAVNGEGIVLTSKLDSRRGNVVGVIIKNGILRRGDFISTGQAKGKIKILQNFAGKAEDILKPSSPALVVGFENLPAVGEIFKAAPSKRDFSPDLSQNGKETRSEFIEGSLRVILKADDSGTLEVLMHVIERINKELPIVVVSKGVGDIFEGDIKTADSAGGVVVGFNVKIDKAAKNLAAARHTTIIFSNIIYELEKKVRDYAKKLYPTDIQSVEILAVFGPAKGKERIVGGKVDVGPVKNQSTFEIWRGGKMIGGGKIINLQSGKENIQEAESGREIGILVESPESIKVGDKLLFPPAS